LTGGEIVADGFRNAYDFAFNRQGDLFTYDSDGERDVSLPWYRPTRVFHVLPGSNAGWVTRSWKRPDYFYDMPPVVAEFGRGSPTGVVCYRHRQFPPEYDNALFVLDWTYGRVMAIPLQQAGSTWTGKPIAFMTGVGQFGFAPTDVEVGSDGSLFVSVGGRGTRGGVFRVVHTKPLNQGADAPRSPNQGADAPRSPSELAACLDAPQPLSSWSRARWTPVAEKLGREAFVSAALDEQLSPESRIRAIEILVDLFDGLDQRTVSRLSTADAAEVRARAIWALGRTQTSSPDAVTVSPYLQDGDPLVARFALEALLGADDKTAFDRLTAGLVQQLGGDDRYNRQAASRIVPKLDDAAFATLSNAVSKSGWQAGVSNAVAYVTRKPGVNPYAQQIGLLVLQSKHPTSLKLEAVRLMQLGLGDVGSAGKLPPVFDGYSCPLDLTPHERDLDPLRIAVAEQFPTGLLELDYELARLAAMLAPFNPKLLDKLLAQISAESHPVDDIHYLTAAARIPVDRTRAQAAATAAALVNIEPKIVGRKLAQDSNWDDRIGEMFAEHVKHTPDLPVALLKQPGFGRPGHVLFLSQLPKERLQEAIDAFSRNIAADRNYPWTNDVVFLLGESTNPAHREIVRKLFDEFAVRNAVLMVLAAAPQEVDRPKFIEGLDASQLEVLTSSLEALGKLSAGAEPAEQFALLRTLRRLGSEDREFPPRETVVKLLRRNTRQEFGFVFGKEGYTRQADVIDRWTAWINSQWPDEAAKQFADAGEDLARLKQQLANVDWNAGDVARGETLFSKRQCVQCHGSRRALGPDLAGAARRFSRDDLFTAIVAPNRDVSPRYQTTLIETAEGKVYTGLIVYESVDGLLLRNANNQTFRIESRDIEFRKILTTSLMPKGLLKDLEPHDLADLYSFILSLGGSSPVVQASDKGDSR
jgi:putative heme-binding domain-containing protein